MTAQRVEQTGRAALALGAQHGGGRDHLVLGDDGADALNEARPRELG